MTINELTNFLIIMVLIAGIVLVFAFIIWTFWSAVFIPVVKLRKHNIAKQEDEKEYNRIIVGKAKETELLAAKKLEYGQWAIKLEEAKEKLESIKKETKEVKETAKKEEKKEEKKEAKKSKKK